MNSNKRIEKRPDAVISREAKITILSLLRNFYDEQIFNILIKDFYDSDLEVSLAAINASASIGNEVAVPHLYRMLEHGQPKQKLAAIQTLAQINAPSSIERLAKYFTIFQDADTRREILKAINRISPLHPKARELNRAVLVDPGMTKELYEIILAGLLESGDLDLVRTHLLKAPPDVQRVVFYRLLQASTQEASSFLEFFQDKTVQFDPNTLGCYLCAYELKTLNPQANFVVELLQGSDPRTTTSFLISLSNYNGRIQNPTRVFRLLLRLPYVDQDTEVLTGNFIAKIVTEVRAHSPLLLNEFIFTTATNLDAVFTKIKKQHISLKGIKEREALLAVILARTLEQHADQELLEEILDFFKGESVGNAAALISRIRERLISAPEDEQNRFEACLPLFANPDRLLRLNTYHALARVNLTSPALMRRLNRMIRVIGTLEIRNSARKILEVLSFAREERIHFLEESSVVTLCQLLNKPAIEQAKAVFAEPARYPHSLNGYIRGARFVPAKIFINLLLKLLLEFALNPRTRALIVDSLKNMSLEGIKGIMPALIRAIRLPDMEKNLINDISGILSKYGDSSTFQSLLDLAGSTDPLVSQIGIKTLRNLAKKEKTIPLDVLTNRLYLLLEHKLKSIQIEALLALIALQDDYAIQILDDYIQGREEEAIAEILANLDKPVTHEIISFMLKLLFLDSKTVHTELRRVLPEFCQGEAAEEIRKALLEGLKEKETPAAISPAPALKPVEQAEAGLIEHAKLEYKFRRENAQMLTVLFTDIVSYTEKSSRSDTTTLWKLIQAFEEITLPTIAALKGTLIKKMGDGLLAVFKHPLNAALASLLIQKKIREYNQYRTDAEKFNIRIGLNTGMVIRKDTDIYGDTVNVASRMETSANPGDILLTQVTYEEIKDYVRCTRLGDLQVKGKAEAITAYSADEILIDINQIISEPKQTGAPEAKPLANLKESMFEPDFRLPENLHLDERMLNSLQSAFKEIAKAIEDLAKDYHEEYIFKRYLQEKWNQIVSAREAARV